MTDVYAAIEAITVREGQAVSAVCDVLEVSRSAYHAWLARDPSVREERDAELSPLVHDIFWKHKRRYGARRIVMDLADMEYACGSRRVGKLMRNQHLVAIQPQSFVPKTTESGHSLGYSPNLLLEMPELTGLHQLWVGDKQLRPPTDEGGCRPQAVVIDHTSLFKEVSFAIWRPSWTASPGASSAGTWPIT